MVGEPVMPVRAPERVATGDHVWPSQCSRAPYRVTPRARSSGRRCPGSRSGTASRRCLQVPGPLLRYPPPCPSPTALLAFWKNYDRKLYLRAAQLADELGYDSFWLPEAWGYEIFTLLTEMAVHTKRIKLGTGIVNVFSRTPGLLAMSAATVDEISEGRFILGIGASGKNVIEGFHGRPFEKPLTQVRDVIRVMRTLLAGQKLSDAGASSRSTARSSWR